MTIKETFRQKWEGKAAGSDPERAEFEALLYLAGEIEALKKQLDAAGQIGATPGGSSFRPR